MKKRSKLPKIDDSQFEVIDNRKLTYIVGGYGSSTSSIVHIYKGGVQIGIDD